MLRIGLRSEGERLLEQAGGLRAAFPEAAALCLLPVAGPWTWPPCGDEAVRAARVALGHLRDEMLLVQSGRADSLAVLDDEVACVRRRLARL
jgi:hypothetical protein